MAKTEFSASEKLKEVRREISYRMSVYARRVMNGAMTQEQADRQLAIMAAIADDYSELAQKERML
jgi:hypothetical protein